MNLDVIIGIILFLSTFTVYLKFLAPSIFSGDSADVVIASYSLGIPHPPGFPVCTWIGHLFTLLPVGDIAYRVNLMSAFFGALVISLVYMIIRSLSPISEGDFADHTSRLCAIIGSLSLAVSVSYWSQAEIAEVYTLNAFLIASMILLILTWVEKRDARLLYMFSLLFGLSLGVHAMNILFLLPIVAFLFLVDRNALLNKRTLFSMIALFSATGLLQISYLIIRAWQRPEYSYADIRTMESFLYYITAKEYNNYLFSMSLPAGIAMYIDFLAKNFSLIGMAMGAIGIVISLKRDLLRSALLASLFAANMLFCVQFNSPDIADKLVPSFMIFSVFIGLGIWETLRLIKINFKSDPASGSREKRNFLKIALTALVLIVSATIPITSYTAFSQDVDRSTSIGLSYFLSEAIRDVPENSAIIDQWRTCVPLKYFQIAYGMNPTVDVLAANPIDWPKHIEERINKRDVFLLEVDESISSRYGTVPVMTMPGVGTLYRIYPAHPSFLVSRPTVQHAVNKLFGGKLKLLGYDLNQTESEGKFSITYYWQSIENVSKDYIVYLDLIDPFGEVALEDIHIPIYNSYPTSRWVKNEVFAEKYNISIPPDVQTGTYQMFITGIWNADGSGSYERIFLGNIEISKRDLREALAPKSALP